MTKYQFIQQLGEGAFGKVFLAKEKDKNDYWAFKQLKKAEVIKQKQVDHLKNEIFILNSLSHPFIVRMAGIAQTNQFICIGMEFIAGGELFGYLRKVLRFKKP